MRKPKKITKQDLREWLKITREKNVHGLSCLFPEKPSGKTCLDFWENSRNRRPSNLCNVCAADYHSAYASIHLLGASLEIVVPRVQAQMAQELTEAFAKKHEQIIKQLEQKRKPPIRLLPAITRDETG